MVTTLRWGCEEVNNRGQQLENLILENDSIINWLIIIYYKKI